MDAARFYNRGIDRHRQGMFDQAIADFNEAIKLAPKFAEAYHNRGFAWHARTDYDKAIADFNEAIRLDAKDGTSI